MVNHIFGGKGVLSKLFHFKKHLKNLLFYSTTDHLLKLSVKSVNKSVVILEKSNKYISFHGGLSRYIDLSILILVSVKVSVDTYPDSFPETLENIYLQKSIRVHEINRVRKKNVGPDEIEGKTYYQIGSRPGMNYDWNIRG